jgi:RNA polymerase sigma-70 factor (ECF subfamily)
MIHCLARGNQWGMQKGTWIAKEMAPDDLGGLAPPAAHDRVSTPDPTGEACLRAYQKRHQFLVRMLDRLGVDPGDREDVAQEVFLVLRRNWHLVDTNRSLKGYIFAIAFRVASSHRRRRWREVPHPEVDDVDAAQGPDSVLESREMRSAVRKVLQSIPQPRRAVLIMHELDEIPVKEIATNLSVPLFTVYSRLRTARRELQRSMTTLLGGESPRARRPPVRGTLRQTATSAP